MVCVCVCVCVCVGSLAIYWLFQGNNYDSEASQMSHL